MTDVARPVRVHFAEIEPPIALGPLDGRYRSAIAPLVDYLSEPALNRLRLFVEVEWLIYQCEHQVLPGTPQLSDNEKRYLRDIVTTFGPGQIAELAAIERETVHDVKAVEYFINRRLDAAPTAVGVNTVLGSIAPLVHFGCTSEDINNLSYALMVRGAVEEVWLPAAESLVANLTGLAREASEVAMLSRTHGQPATPTTLGKEVAVLAHRLSRQLGRIRGDEYLGKFNGATGTFGAHVAAAPSVDWAAHSKAFVESLGLTWNPLTTQIESHDWQAELYADIARFNRILHNLATDFWTYISLGYFVQVRDQGTIGSSTMPHKVNPIRFENGEANLEISCALFDSLGATLVTSRLQRDLTDSTTQRNIGPAFGHSLLAISNVQRGISGLDIDAGAMKRDLDANWEVLAEPIQMAMRAAAIAGVPGMADPYERLKDLTRGHEVNADAIREFVETLGLPEEMRDRLAAMTPASYLGIATSLLDYL